MSEPMQDLSCRLTPTRLRALVSYDPLLGRMRGECPVCAYAVVRAKRDSAEHVLAQHIAYQHEDKI